MAVFEGQFTKLLRARVDKILATQLLLNLRSKQMREKQQGFSTEEWFFLEVGLNVFL